MFVNELNLLYRPKRILYYIDASKEDIDGFCRGKIPEEIGGFANTFGTYDGPGVFFIKELEKNVIGIEFNIDGEIDKNNPNNNICPQGVKSVVLDEAFFFSVEIDNEVTIDTDMIRRVFMEKPSGNLCRLYTEFKLKNNPNYIGVFSGKKKLRLLYEAELFKDKATPVLTDEAANLTKDDLYKYAFRDLVTGHYNWNHILAYIEMPMELGVADFAFAHFDIKQFSVINEVYGHEAANKVLKNVVKAMNEADYIFTSARCHNDNFAMMIKDMPDDEMMEKLSGFFAGISVLEEDPNYEIMYRCGVVPMQIAMLYGNRVADAAKLAQSMGTHQDRTDIIVYTDKMHEDVQWANYIKAYVDTAIENDEFVVYLQPKFDITSLSSDNKEKSSAASTQNMEAAHIKGAEALIRWNYRNREFLAPYRFIPFFEKDGAIGKIDDIVLDKVCAALNRWKNEGKPLYPISVNLSRSRLYDKNLTKHLASIVDKYEVDHALIDFELTESASYDDQDQMLRVLNDLRDRGFKISMDDFGTGYSSLSLLTEMPLDTLKIDKSFVDHIGTNDERKKDLVVIRHIISLAKELDFKCLAEGAEEASQVERLAELGCEIVQGYFFSKPVSIEEYENSYLK